MIEQYQSHILKPAEVVDYSAELIHGLRPETIQNEPLIGFKVLVRDTNAHITSPAARFQFLETNLGFLQNSGCILRESQPNEALDGFWVITFPVPQSNLSTQIMNMTRILDCLTASFGIIPANVVEISVSGRCGIGETEWRLANINLPMNLRQGLVEPTNTPYKLGHLIRINDDFAILRTMWDWRNCGSTTNSHLSDLLVIPQLLCGMFH